MPARPALNQELRGQVLAALIAAGWLASLWIGLQGQTLLLALVLVPLRTLLQTGLFIVGHDAMHGLLLPRHRRFNDRLGALVLALYAALPYGRCRHQHHLHHRHAGGPDDPDGPHPDGPQGGWMALLAWYGRFMGRYLNAGQMAGLLAAWGLLAWATSIPAVLLVCTLPLLLSSLQLFVVGTYLPHRGQDRAQARTQAHGQGSGDHTAISLDLPEWLSLLACFHFGYHREHHQAPQLAWHQLPAQRRISRVVALATADVPQ